MRSYSTSFFMALAAVLMVIGGHRVALADDMDFGNLEAEQVKKGAPTLEEGKASTAVGGEDGQVTGTSGYSGTAGAWNAFKRNLGFGYFNYANMTASEVNRGKGFLETYNYLSMEYRLGRGEKVFFRPAFLFQSSGEDLRGVKQDSKFAWSDVYFGYASYNLPWLPFEMDYKSEFRVYLPTSDTSQNEGMIARLRGDMKAYYPLSGRTTFLLWFKPDYFVQRRTAKLNARGYPTGTRDYGYELSANLYYQMRGGIFGLGSSLQHEQYWTNDSVVENVSVYRREDVSAQVFVGINAYGLLTHIGIDQTRNVSAPRDEFVALRDTETQYFARSYYRF